MLWGANVVHRIATSVDTQGDGLETSNGLPQHGASDDVEPLDERVPRLRLGLSAFDVQEANAAFLRLVGLDEAAVLGRSLHTMCAEREQEAVRQRLDDVVVLGRDRIAALALPAFTKGPRWVEVEARYDWRGGERLELRFESLRGPGGASPADDEPSEDTVSSDEDAPCEATIEAVEDPDAEPAETAADASSEAGAEPAVAWCDETAGAVVAEGVTIADAAGVAVLALAPGWRVAGASGRAVQLCGARPVPAGEADAGTRMSDLLRMAEETGEALEIARRDGRRQAAHAVSRAHGEDVVVEWVPGLRPGFGWLVLGELPGEDPTTARLLQAEWHVYQVAHDARNQLAEIDAGLELLDETLAPPAAGETGASLDGEAEREQLRRTVALTRAACATALEIIHDVHEETEEAQDSRREVDLGRLVSRTLARYEPRALARGVRLEEELSSEIWVRAEPSRLRRVLTNLFDNALQAMADGGSLRARSVVEDHERPGVLLSVSDTGSGIPPERVERIFLPGETTTPGSKGRGLAIVHRFVLGCGGEIRCDSRPGQGTTFHIWLPRIV